MAQPTTRIDEPSEFVGRDIAAILARHQITTRELAPQMEPPISHQRVAALMLRRRPLQRDMVQRLFVALRKIIDAREREQP